MTLKMGIICCWKPRQVVASAAEAIATEIAKHLGEGMMMTVNL